MARSRKTDRAAPGRLRAVAGLVVARPAASGGTLLMAVTGTAILVNALALQPGPHPAPLFRDTRPVAADERPAPEPVAAMPDAVDSIDDLVARTTGRAPPARDEGLVSEIQTELKARGYYDGVVDGLTGPMTAAAIAHFEGDAGLPVTGEPTGDVLAALRAGGGAPPAAPRSEDAPAPQTRLDTPPAPVPATTAAEPAPVPAAVPAPRARPVLTEVSAQADPEVTDAVAPAPAQARTAPPPPDPRLARVQEALDLLGYGPLAADGEWTPATRAAIRRFEENRDLPVTGELTPAFLAELVRIGGLSDG
jgi:peptidoglycan hydrolase-like protein with peptidoglycan-binding domain